MTDPLKLARILALATPLALLGGALAFQFWGGLYPCEMCWWQRYGHIAALVLALGSFALPARRWPVALAALALGVAGLIGAYHAGVEYGWWMGLTGCTSTVHFDGGDPLKAVMADSRSARTASEDLPAELRAAGMTVSHSLASMNCDASSKRPWSSGGTTMKPCLSA